MSHNAPKAVLTWIDSINHTHTHGYNNKLLVATITKHTGGLYYWCTSIVIDYGICNTSDAAKEKCNKIWNDWLEIAGLTPVQPEEEKHHDAA